MIEYEPTGAYTYQWSKKPTLKLFKRALNKFDKNDKVVDPGTRIEEWGSSTGLKKPNGQKHGIVRYVSGRYI